jgi:hypothetical protein
MTNEELKAKAVELVEMRWASSRNAKRTDQQSPATGAIWSDLERAMREHKDAASVQAAKDAASKRVRELSDKDNEKASEFLKANPDIAPWFER